MLITLYFFHSVNIRFSGSVNRGFSIPQAPLTVKSDYKTDPRTTLLWEPNIESRQQEVLLNYYNSDNPSK